jgi:hypothetical protein
MTQQKLPQKNRELIEAIDRVFKRLEEHPQGWRMAEGQAPLLLRMLKEELEKE